MARATLIRFVSAGEDAMHRRFASWIVTVVVIAATTPSNLSLTLSTHPIATAQTGSF